MLFARPKDLLLQRRLLRWVQKNRTDGEATAGPERAKRAGRGSGVRLESAGKCAPLVDDTINDRVPGYEEGR